MTLESVNYIYLEACNKPNRLSITIFFSSIPPVSPPPPLLDVSAAVLSVRTT